MSDMNMREITELKNLIHDQQEDYVTIRTLLDGIAIKPTISESLDNELKEYYGIVDKAELNAAEVLECIETVRIMVTGQLNKFKSESSLTSGLREFLKEKDDKYE